MRRYIVSILTFVIVGAVCLPSSHASGLGYDVRDKQPLTTKGDITTYTTTIVRLGVGNDGEILSADSSTSSGLKWVTAPTGGGSGETNTASNVGTGNEVFKQKSSVDFEFRTIISGDAISYETTANTIKPTILESQIDHQNLNGAASETHASIDTHLNNSTPHRIINDSGTSATENWSANKINSELGGKSDSGHDHNMVKAIFFDAPDLKALENNFVPIEKVVSTDSITFFRAFDSTTGETANGKILVPDNVDTSGVTTFRVYGTAKVPAASGVVFSFWHKAKNGGEDWEASNTQEQSGTGTFADGNEGTLLELTWTETIANMAWSSSDIVYFILSRDTTAGGDDLTGDFYLHGFSIEIPRS